MRIVYTGFGAVREVPGSMHLLDVEGVGSILTDCGITYDRTEDNKTQAAGIPFNIDDLVAALFTHGHADHVGNIPMLREEGYSGSYFSTPATMDLVGVQLKGRELSDFFETKTYNDSIRGKRDKDGNYIPFKKRAFGKRERNEILDAFIPVKYGRRFTLLDDDDSITAKFHDAGHIIGSSQILYNFDGQKVLMCFDLGRSDINTPILRYPWKIFDKDIDYVFVESTYGNKLHENKKKTMDKLGDIINESYSKSGKIICGAFSIMRTQLVLEDLFRLYKQRKIPEDFKIYLDSPTALLVNSIIKRHSECFDCDTRKEFANPKCNPFKFPRLITVRDSRKSKKLKEITDPHMIISASGMYNMGRIVRHLKNNIEDENTTFLITGYQAKGTNGRKLIEGKDKHPILTIDNETYEYKANVRRIRGYSGHADPREITRHLKHMRDPLNNEQFKGIYIVHGEYEANLALKAWLENEGFKNIVIPEKGVEYELNRL